MCAHATGVLLLWLAVHVFCNTINDCDMPTGFAAMLIILT